MDTEAFAEKIEKIKMPYRIAILAGTVVLLSVAFFFGVYSPKTKAIEETRGSIRQLEHKLARVKRSFKTGIRSGPSSRKSIPSLRKP